MPEQCTNCEAAYDGRYCPACGQRAGGLDQDVTVFARELVEETLGLDSRVRLTVPALFFRPGEIAKEYVEGRRARFVPPIRLYLFSSFVMFLALSQAGVEVENVTVAVGGTPVEVDSAALSPGRPVVGEATTNRPADSYPEQAPQPRASESDEAASLEDVVAERISRGLLQISDDPETFSRLFFNRMAQSMFFLLPAFALLLKAVYRKRAYLHHGIFAIYFHCFVFLIVTVSTIPDALGLPAVASLADALLIVIPIYLVLAMKRFYDEGWLQTALKAWTVSVTYGVMGGMMMVGLLMASLLTM